MRTSFARHEETALRLGWRITERGEIRRPDGKTIGGWLNQDGYHCFAFFPNGKRNGNRRKILVSRLVALQKFGPAALYAPGIEVRHLDNNQRNNFIDNIAIGTPSENAMDRHPEKRKAMANRATSFVLIHNHAAIIEMFRRLAGNKKRYEIVMAEFGITSKGTLSFIVNKSNAASAPLEAV